MLFTPRHDFFSLDAGALKHGQSFEKTVSAFKSGNAPLEYHVFPAGGKMLAAKGAIQHIPVTRVTSDAHAHSHYQAALKAGYEGQIIQTPDGSVQKRKPVQDSEYTVVGAARGKKHGILTVRDGAGKTFRVQAPAHLAHEAQVGKQATVGYTRLTSSGVPHAPVFKAVRDYELSVREFACNLMKKPNVFLKKRPPIARNSMREVGQAMGGPTATFQRKAEIRHFAFKLKTIVKLNARQTEKEFGIFGFGNSNSEAKNPVSMQTWKNIYRDMDKQQSIPAKITRPTMAIGSRSRKMADSAAHYKTAPRGPFDRFAAPHSTEILVNGYKNPRTPGNTVVIPRARKMFSPTPNPTRYNGSVVSNKPFMRAHETGHAVTSDKIGNASDYLDGSIKQRAFHPTARFLQPGRGSVNPGLVSQNAPEDHRNVL